MTNRKNKFRIGKDAHFQLKVKTNEEILTLSGRDIRVELVSPLNRKLQMKISITGNIIYFDFPGIEQKELGYYRITVWENKDKVGETAHDICDAFKIVRTTCQEDDQMDGLDCSDFSYDIDLQVMTKCGIFSDTVRYMNVVTQEEYEALPEHNSETLYIIK